MPRPQRKGTRPIACRNTKAFDGYLAGGQEEGKEYDATVLLSRHEGAGQLPLPMLVDCGADDTFLNDPNQLRPEALVAAMDAVAGHGTGANSVRMREGYDHSYYFISSFMEEHVAWHADHLK